jgi:long-chain acyl-CoA synthetase
MTLLINHPPAAPALVFEGELITYGTFEAETNRIANAFAASGIGPGARVVYLGKNTAAFFLLLYGAMKAGVVVAPLNWRLAPPEIDAIIADARAAAVVFGREYAGLPDYAHLAGTTLLLAAESTHPAMPSLGAWAAPHPETRPAYTPAETDIAVQLYTSGTTGLPKGVMLSHESIESGRHASAAHDLGWNQWSAADKALLAMPVSHVSGTVWGIIALYHGATCFIQRQFDLEATFDSIERDRITRFFLVPAALQMLVRHPRAASTDFSCLHEVGYGASPMPLPLLRACMAVMGTRFVQFYGMTETSGTIVALSPEDHARAAAEPEAAHLLRAAGRPLPWVELRAVDATGADVASGTVGEIITRSPANMKGYWQKPGETARTMDAEGWLHTGDAGYIDDQGYVFIHDRMKDMIISGGENVYPAEVESALAEHPAVSDVAVIGVPDARWGETVKAIVVLRPDARLSADELIAWSRARIAGFKSPSSVDFVESLPRNASGKLLKRALRAPYWEGQARQIN